MSGERCPSNYIPYRSQFVSSDSTNVSAPNKNTQQYASMQPITIMLLSLGDDCLMILKSKTVRLKD